MDVRKDILSIYYDIGLNEKRSSFGKMSQRYQVIQLYKTLLHLGKDYPQGYDFFRTRLKQAFMKNRDVQDIEKIKKMIKHGEFIIKELEALYMLRKYRTLKHRYYNKPEDEMTKKGSL